MPLASEFPQATEEEWRDLVATALNGAPFDKKLVTSTYDGLQIQPLYTPDESPEADPEGFPGLAPFTRGARPAGHGVAGWDLRQNHELTDEPATVNKALLADLDGGATSVLLTLPGPSSVDAIGAALENVLLDVAPIALDAGPWYAEAVAALLDEWDRRDIPPSARLGSLRADPIGALARHGALQTSVTDALAGLAGIVATVADSPGVRTLGVDATVYADAGAGEAEEVALSLTTATTYLRALCSAGLSVDEALNQIEFSYAASADQFATVCKLRAARRCWSRVAEASGATAGLGGQRQHAVTSAAMMSRRDPWVNLLRTTVACFAAGVGGAEIITVRPFDSAVGRPDALGRRLARNISHLLVDESRIDDVIDPSGGSHFVEEHTADLAQLAWTRFQELEAGGGIIAGLESSAVQAGIQQTWQERLGALATRRDALTGISEFPDVHETAIARDPHTVPAVVAQPAATVESVPLRRLAEPFESLRDTAEAISPSPTVFLANLGPVAAHTARATFAKNFFEAGGIEALGNDGFESPAELAEAFTAGGATMAVLCSSDELYPELVPEAAAALKSAGCERLYLAGRPGDRADADFAAGVDSHIYAGADVVGLLSTALGVSQ